MKKQEIVAYYEEEGRELKPNDVDKYYRGVFRYASTHGCRRVILEKWLKLTKPNETFLDVGCELGYFVRKMAEKGLDATGVDVSPTKVRKARYIAKILNLDCGFQVMDAENLEFGDNSFDWVLCSETLEHILNDQRATQELIRVSKRNIIITVPQKSIFWRFLNIFSDIYGFNTPGAGHLREYTPNSLLNLFQERIQVKSLKKAGYFFSYLDRFLPDFSIFKVILCLFAKKIS
ncbi:MAG: class I SAM-dependent methyltransferase [Candidatus Helarchaeota archaeon]|nr:class I SAM-dependent methyltransferase [Candidatus Helarchaeota archaeon]